MCELFCQLSSFVRDGPCGKLDLPWQWLEGAVVLLFSLEPELVSEWCLVIS